MKRIKQTLAAGFLACAALNQAKAEVSQAKAEVSPWSYGAKGFGTISGLMGVGTEMKVNGKQGNTKLFDLGTLWASGGFYGEYAFSNYLGAAVDLRYMMTGGKFIEKPEEAATKSATPNEDKHGAINFHSVVMPISLCIYPLGYEAEQDHLKVFLGATVSYTFMPKLTEEAKKADVSDALKEQLASFDFGVHLAGAYEWVNGFSVEAGYTFNFMDRFNVTTDKPDVLIKGVTKLKGAKTHGLAMGVGFNAATLFSE